MHKAIEENRRLLEFCYSGTRFIGGMLLFVGSILVAVLFLGLIAKVNVNQGNMKYEVPTIILKLMFPGVLLLGVAQFLKCLFEAGHKPSWILRYGNRILYLYAVLLIGNRIWGFVRLMEIGEKSYFDFFAFAPWVLLVAYLPSLLVLAAKVLILVGLGQIMQRIIMPIIEDSRT